MTIRPRSSVNPFWKFLRTFQSNAVLIAFSTASAPPSTKKTYWKYSGLAMRANVSTNSAISTACAGPVGLSKSSTMRQPMSRSARAASSPAFTPAHTVSTGTPRRITNPGEKNISR